VTTGPAGARSPPRGVAGLLVVCTRRVAGRQPGGWPGSRSRPRGPRKTQVEPPAAADGPRELNRAALPSKGVENFLAPPSSGSLRSRELLALIPCWRASAARGRPRGRSGVEVPGLVSPLQDRGGPDDHADDRDDRGRDDRVGDVLQRAGAHDHRRGRVAGLRRVRRARRPRAVPAPSSSPPDRSGTRTRLGTVGVRGCRSTGRRRGRGCPARTPTSPTRSDPIGTTPPAQWVEPYHPVT